MSTWISALRKNLLDRGLLASARVRRFTAAAALVLCTAVSAWIVIPIPGSPVPVTLQTFVVLAGAALLGGRVGASAQAAYLILGGVGLPFLTSGLGGPMMFGATGGYLIGFVLASWLIGAALRNLPASGPRLLGALVLGEAAILACGVVWLSAFLRVSLNQALLLGALPFLPGDALKLAAAAALARTIGARSRRFVA